MNREFLKNAGVADEAVERIMAEYGRDVQAEKDKALQSANSAEAVRKELETYKSKVEELEKAAGDNDAVRKELDDLKAKIADEKKAADEKAADEALTAAIKGAIPAEKKFVNEFTENALIAQVKAALGQKENVGKSAAEVLDALTKDKSGIFANPNPLDVNIPPTKNVDIEAGNEADMRRIFGLTKKEN